MIHQPFSLPEVGHPGEERHDRPYWMYKCEICRRTIGPRVPSARLVIETQRITYPPRKKANIVKAEGKIKIVDDPGGTGEAIARELTVCPECAKRQKE